MNDIKADLHVCPSGAAGDEAEAAIRAPAASEEEGRQYPDILSAGVG